MTKLSQTDLARILPVVSNGISLIASVPLFTLATDMDAEPSAGSIFPRTDWAELSKAADAEQAPLDRLIRLYWQPLKIFLVATFPNLSGQADELLQDFAGDKILREGWLKKPIRRAGASGISLNRACGISFSIA